MIRAFTLRTIQWSNPRRIVRCARAVAIVLSLLLTTGLRPAFALNVLTNPGFEDGNAAWDTNTWAAGAGQEDTTVVHSGTKSWKWDGTGATPDAWQGGRQLNVPVSETKFYQYTAWVNVPTADANANKFGWTWRHNKSDGAGGVDLGYTVITAPGWTQVKAPIVQPASGTTSFGYVGFHTLNYGGQIPFYLDDVAVEQLDALVLNGRVVTSGGAGVADATVSAASADYTAPNTTTDANGYYTFTVPAGTYTISAGSPGFKGSTTKQVSSTPTTADNIVMSVDPDYDADLLFSAYSSSIPDSGPWPTASPAGLSLTRMNNATTEMIDGVKWEKNVADGPGWRFGDEYTADIPVAGATAVAVIRMPDTRSVANDPWDSVIDVFYNRLVLGVGNATGLLQVKVSPDSNAVAYAPANTALAANQKAVLSLVVQPDATYKAFINGTEVISGTGEGDMAALRPGPQPYMHYINVGRNNPDGWSTFNGNIGDVFLYKTALTDTKRTALEQKLMTKFAINPTVYHIAASEATPGGKLRPFGTVGVPAGTDKTFTITPFSLYRIDRVVVDGVDKGPITSYTFKNVQDDTHTIVAYFAALPTQIVSGRVTDGTQGIFGATVYFKSSPDASVNPDYTTPTTTYDGHYALRVPTGTWYVSASADAYATAADVYPVTVAGAPVTQNLTLAPLVSKIQPMLVNKGTGAARTDMSGTVGYSFTTGSSVIEVSALGFVDWDKNGLLADHDVGIFVSQLPNVYDVVVSATVPAGTAGNLIGDYRYVTLSQPVRLAPNTSYTVGAVVATGGDPWPAFAPNPGFNAPDFLGITQVRGRSIDGSFLEAPTADLGDGVDAAPNLIGRMVTPSMVKGVVKNASGVGINSAVLQLGGPGGPATVTDANGEYRLTGIPLAAGLELFADAVGYADHTETIDTTNAETAPIVKNITLTAKAETGVGINGGFEAGTAGWSIANQQPGDTISTVSPGYSGNYAGKFTPGTFNSWTWMHQILDIVPGSVYTVTFKGYTDPGVTEWFPMVAFRNDAGDELKGWISGEPGYDGWVHYPPHTWKQYLLFHTYTGDAIQPFVRIAPPEGATKIDFWFGVGGGIFDGESAYADDVVIDRIGPDLPNPPFNMMDVVDSLRWTSGLAELPPPNLTRFDVVTDGRVNSLDATRILRKVTGLEANP